MRTKLGRSRTHTLEPLTKAGGDLQVLMGYRYPGDGTKAAIEIYPIAGKKVTAAASQAGLAASSIPTLLVEGDNRPGLALAIAEAIAEAGVNMTFFVAQAIDRRFSAVLGFETEVDTKTAAPLIRHATARRKKWKAKAKMRLASVLFGGPLVGNLKRRRISSIDPATLGKDVVGLSATSCNQFIADFLRKRDVHQTVAMYVADLSSP